MDLVVQLASATFCRIASPIELPLDAAVLAEAEDGYDVELDVVPDASFANRLADGLKGTFEVRGNRHVACSVPDSDAELGTALRICCALVQRSRGGLLLHAAGLMQGGRGILALAQSGGGKSTLVDLAKNFLSLSDETIAIDIDDGPKISGTIFRSSSPRLPSLVSCKLAAVVVLEKRPVPSLSPITPSETTKHLLGATYRLPQVRTAELLPLAARLAEAVPAFRFGFPKSEIAERALRTVLGD